MSISSYADPLGGRGRRVPEQQLYLLHCPPGVRAKFQPKYDNRAGTPVFAQSPVPAHRGEVRIEV
jgi:hypothetical protein